jgi:DNA-binding transcriptional ArsR family regulator
VYSKRAFSKYALFSKVIFTLIACFKTPPDLQFIHSTKWLTIDIDHVIFNHMVTYTSVSLDAVFHALADQTRREMLRMLSAGQQTVGQLAAPFTMSLAAASKHVKVLELAGLVRRQINGRTHVCQLAPAPLLAATEWLRFYETFWTERFDALERLLAAEDADRRSSTTGDEAV